MSHEIGFSRENPLDLASDDENEMNENDQPRSSQSATEKTPVSVLVTCPSENSASSSSTRPPRMLQSVSDSNRQPVDHVYIDDEHPFSFYEQYAQVWSSEFVLLSLPVISEDFFLPHLMLLHFIFNIFFLRIGFPSFL